MFTKFAYRVPLFQLDVSVTPLRFHSYRCPGRPLTVRGFSAVSSDRRLVPAQVDETDGRLRWTFSCTGTPIYFIRFSVSSAVSQLWTSPR